MLLPLKSESLGQYDTNSRRVGKNLQFGLDS